MHWSVCLSEPGPMYPWRSTASVCLSVSLTVIDAKVKPELTIAMSPKYHVSPLCSPRYVQYCRDHYGNGHCESGCRSGPCGWDGVDCFGGVPRGVVGSLVLLTPLSVGEVLKGNLSLLWGLSAVLRTGVRIMGTPRPSDPHRDLRDLHDLRDLQGSGPGQEEDDVTG